MQSVSELGNQTPKNSTGKSFYLLDQEKFLCVFIHRSSGLRLSAPAPRKQSGLHVCENLFPASKYGMNFSG